MVDMLYRLLVLEELWALAEPLMASFAVRRQAVVGAEDRAVFTAGLRAAQQVSLTAVATVDWCNGAHGASPVHRADQSRVMAAAPWAVRHMICTLR